MKKSKNEIIANMLVLVFLCCVVYAVAVIGLSEKKVQAHVENTKIQRIREEDGLTIWKIQDSVSDCYVVGNFWYRTSSAPLAISCVKR